MSRTLAIYVMMSLITIAPIAAQDTNDVFLSLTRRAERIEDLPTDVSVVTANRIVTEEAITLDDTLTRETDINVSKNGTVGQTSNMKIRGATSEQSLLLIDGRRSNSISLGQADLSTIAASKIDHLEIIRGAASAIYGTSAFGGVVNIITKRATENTPLVDLGISYGSFNTQVYSLNSGIKKDNLSGMLMINKTLSDGWRKNSDFDANDFTTNLDYDSGSSGLFDLSGSVYRSDFGVPGQLPGLTPDKFNGEIEKTASTPDARQQNNNQYLQLTHTKSWGGDTLKTRIYTSEDRMNFKVPSWFSNNDYDSLVYGAEETYGTAAGLTVGGEWWEEKHKQDDIVAAVTPIDRSRVNSAAYIQQEVKWGNELSLIPSFRFDDNSSFGSVMTPRLSIVCQPSEQWKLSASSGKAWRAPTFNELYYPLDPWGFSGNPNLKPEEGISSDIGAELRFGSQTASLTLFQTDTKNLIVWSMMPENISTSRQQGAELSVSGRLLSGLSHRLGYTYLWAEDLDTNTQIIYRPRNTVNYDLSCTMFGSTKIDLAAQYVSSQLTESAGTDLPEYTLLNLRVAQKISDAEVWVKADNITDTKYENKLGYPLPGLTLAAGINVKFWD